LEVEDAIKYLDEKEQELLLERIPKILYALALKTSYYAKEYYVPIRTGRLKESIRVERISEEEFDSVAGGITIRGLFVNYAVFVEFGTSRMVGRFYMTAGYNRAMSEMNQIVMQIMESSPEATLGMEETEVPLLIGE
jgi:hypothetical protein